MKNPSAAERTCWILAGSAILLLALHIFFPLEGTQKSTWSAAPHQTSRSLPKRVISINTFYFPFNRDELNMTRVEQESSAADQFPEDYLNKYFTPLVNVILNWQWLLPEWRVLIYISKGHPYVRQLRRLGAEVREEEFQPTRWSAATAWRFLAEDDPTLELWASRESESPPTFQDAMVLKHWSECTDYPLHAIHVAGAHVTWNSGLFGARRGFLSNVLSSSMAGALKHFSDKIDGSEGRLFGSRYGDDQAFLGEVWKVATTKDNGIAYESHAVKALNRTFCHFKECVEIPGDLAIEEQELGFRVSMNHVGDDELVLCHHEKAPFCRRHRFKGVRAWKGLYELCTGEDFFTGLPSTGSQLELDKCPYRHRKSEEEIVEAGDFCNESGQ
jgi:hypothetical protein